MSVYPTCKQFSEQVGTRCSATLGEETAELELVAAIEGTRSGGYTSYSVELTGTGAPLPQATYTFTHEVLGTHDIFLVPIASDGDVTRYQAVFNVTKESEG
jgi:hypothetical protein